MNILIPHHWLLEQVKTQASPQKIQEYLSLCGPSVENIVKVGKESVYNIEITTNRVDSMSVRGVARELAVILPQFDIPAKLVTNTLSFSSLKPTTRELLPLPKIRNNAKLSRRIVCIILSNIKRTPTPQWMADRLTQVGMNIHDSAIDITNYVTHELGHPIHAFDYDKIMKMGGEIIVTKARKGEHFITLDGENYQAVGGEVVFKNPKGTIIDLPAIKGTMNSAVDDTTKNILLWMESIDAEKIRFASMTHTIRTVAAQLAEKNVDPHFMEPTLVRGVQLYRELCDAKIASELYDAFPGKKPAKTVGLDLNKIHTYLGIELPISKIVTILEKLQFRVKTLKNTLHVTPPTFRQDVTIPADFIEEIARVYGYHHLPSVVMPTRIPLTKPKNTHFAAEETIKHFLADLGWQEVYTYSMVSEVLAQQSGYSLQAHAKLANPLTDDKIYLRRSLTPSLLAVIENNPQKTAFSVFELANVYQPRPNTLPDEVLRLGLASTKPYRQVRGDVEALLKKFYLPPLTVKVDEVTQHGQLMVGKTAIGTIQVEKGRSTTAQLDFHQLLPIIKTHPSFQPLPKTASVIEKFTFTLPINTAVGPIIDDLQVLDRRIKSVVLTDIYQANHTFLVEYWDSRHNLANEDVRPIRRRIVTLVEKTYRAKHVGTVQ